jgi:hypothetical protein
MRLIPRQNLWCCACLSANISVLPAFGRTFRPFQQKHSAAEEKRTDVF